MSSVTSFINHQLGLKKWTRYDGFLERFVCARDDEYASIYGTDAHYLQEPPIFACEFANSQNYTNLLALANETGTVVVVDVEKDYSKRVGCEAHSNAIFDLAWLPNSSKLLTASGDHSAALLNLGEGVLEVETTFLAHSRSLKTIATCEDSANVFATGGRDARINIWDMRVKTQSLSMISPELEFYIPFPHLRSSQVDGNRLRTTSISAANSVTGLIFQNDRTLISCGAGDGFIKFWDMRKTWYARNRVPVPKFVIPYAGNTLKVGFSNLAIDYSGNILYASCLDNTIYAYNINSYAEEPVITYNGHENNTFYVKMCLAGDGQYILSGSSDNNAYIWHKNSSYPIMRLVGHEAEVTGVAWNSVNNGLIVTCSDDCKQKFWSISKKVLTEKEKLQEYVGYAEAVSRNQEKKCKKMYTECSTEIFSSCLCNEFKTDESECHSQLTDLPTLPGENPNNILTRLSVRLVETVVTENTNKRCLEDSLTDAENNVKRKRMEVLDINSPSTSQLCKDNNRYSTNNQLCDKDMIDTLLSNLPNFEVDGIAPHINVSPVKRPEKDWLTKLRFQLKSTSINELSKITSSESEKLPNPSSTTKINQSPSKGPILRYFKVTNSRLSTTPKSPSVVLPSTPPTPSD